MAKIDLKFLDCIEENKETFIQVKSHQDSSTGFGDLIAISGNSSAHGKLQQFFISLDKSTAIKFAKTLRTEINKIKE